MYDLSNLNDYEFEVLCLDIMQKLLDIKLFIFSRGVDQGIDICDKSSTPSTVIQVKHYAGSTYGQLKVALKKEIVKIKEHSPENYYVCTSQSLTRANKKEIMSFFPEFIHDISHIVDKNDINQFLQKQENNEIVQKNYKLWLNASNVLSLINNQDVFIDCEEILWDIENQMKLFVETTAYREALEKLKDDNIIIIVGAPGVGKSTLSKMVLMYYANEGYSIRFASNNNISDIKKVLSCNPNKKEIVLLDDFLGQHYLNLKDSHPSELKTLISFIARHNQKKIIFNSRITILTEAVNSSLIFNDVMDKHESNKYLLDLDKMSDYEKAKILYNHLYFNALPPAYWKQIKLNRNYLKIIKHQNYNPRIIEFVTKKRNYKNICADDYVDYIYGKLNNPEDVWRDEFRNRLDKNDRMLMNTLYSLSDTMISDKILKQSFNERIINQYNQDTSVNQYESTLIRLTDSLIKNIEDKKEKKISIINPSINDYLSAEIMSNSTEQIKIIDNAIYFEQIFKIMKSEEAKQYFVGEFINGKFSSLRTLKHSYNFYFLKSIVTFDIYKLEMIEGVRHSLEEVHKTINYWWENSEYGEIIEKLFVEKFFDFYNLQDIFFSEEKIIEILNPVYFEKLIEIIKLLLMSDGFANNPGMIIALKKVLLERTTQEIINQVDDEASDIISKILDHHGVGDECIDEIENGVYEEAGLAIKKYVYKKLEECLEIFKEQIDIPIKKANFDIPYICSVFDVHDIISSLLDTSDSQLNILPKKEGNSLNDSIIVTIFER